MNRLIVILVTLLAVSTGSAFADNGFAKSAIQRFYRQQNILGGNGQYRLTEKLVQIKPDGERTSRQAMIYVHSPVTTMVVLQFPNQPPELFLRNAHGSWLYKEGLRTPLRINETFKVFGAANLADVLGIDLQDNYSIKSTSSTSGGASLLVTLAARSTNLPYPSARLELDLANGDFKQLKLDGANGVALKEVKFSDYHTVSGSHRFATWGITNLLFPDEGSTLITFTALSRTDLPDSLFRPTGFAMRSFLSRVQF